jgi:quercetin dioxygenase-like cupin family protein
MALPTAAPHTCFVALLTVGMASLGTSCASRPEVRIAAAVPAAAAPAISRTLLEHHDIEESPGWETRLYLIRYEPGAAAPVHHHPVEGMGYVVRGSFESAFQGEAPVVVHEGQSFRDHALVPHVLFRNISTSTPLDFVITYVVRKAAPVLETP